MKNVSILALALLVGACQVGESQQIRLSGGMEETRADVTYTERGVWMGNQWEKESSADYRDTTKRGRIEWNATTKVGPSMGFYTELGDNKEFDTTHLSGGVIGRHHFAEGDLRPYLEGRLGYRHTWMDDFDGHGIDAGAGLGLEYSLGKGASIFAQIDYNYGTTSFHTNDGDHFSASGTDLDAEFGGVGFMIGGGFSW
jgi:hypothetical protein